MTAPRAARPAARILLLDAGDRVLLFRFDPADRPPFWCTPGGAVDPGESYAQAARRELREETGIDAEPGAEVAQRFVQFTTIEGVPVDADERYFLVRTDAGAIDTGGHTALEQRVMRSWRWFTRAEIAAHDEPIFPEDLIEMIDVAQGSV
ncbi:NUDIX hydrolase [Sphingomonas hengshuiensis]|uniref:DNA mismatch repair protein MutT n=1 Tax=Sphingomonas hengshuiensis TaxID=1609977 RepID=A0A7U5BF40_9SPHN|nr:NUDIX domain-containing protein [Sphingomonas hengshuiensis]AJP74123.1 DNA mismatch repair protein MutT [Sphingomonas hengshuiensis]